MDIERKRQHSAVAVYLQFPTNLDSTMYGIKNFYYLVRLVKIIYQWLLLDPPVLSFE